MTDEQTPQPSQSRPDDLDSDVPVRFETLLQAVACVPVPTSRPDFGRADEATGLTLLDTALQLRHVYRITDQLTLIDNGHLRRSVAIDVDLRKLTGPQCQALAVREPTGERKSPGTRPIWVPVALQSRSDLAPVDVHDAHDAVVPRLTQDATFDQIIAGMVRVFRLQVQAERAITPEATEALPLRARWLIERAIAHLIQYGRSGAWPGLAADPTVLSPQGAGDAPLAPEPPAAFDRDNAAQLFQIRDQASRFLRAMAPEHAAPFADLLNLAVENYLVVVMLPADQALHHLRYDAPLMPAMVPTHRFLRWVKHSLPLSREFTIEYETHLPRKVNAYHVTFEVQDEIRVRWFLLRTDADQQAVQRLVSDVRALADAAKEEPRDQDDDVLRGMEIQDVLSRLAVLARRRLHELDRFCLYTQRRLLSNGRRPVGQPAERANAGQKSRVDLGWLAALSSWHEQGRQPTTIDWAAIADFVENGELGMDVSLDNDPRENGAHAHWRHLPLSFGPPTVESVRATVHVSLADEPPALLESVYYMLLALLGVVGLMWLFLKSSDGGLPGLLSGWRPVADSATRSSSPGQHLLSSTDALVTVLLLVPGILVSRLNIPSTHSVLGSLRVFPVRIAYAAVIVMSALAVATAVIQSTGDLLSAVQVAGLMLLGLTLACAAELMFRLDRRHAELPRSTSVPCWLRTAMGESTSAPRVIGDADVRFQADGSHSEGHRLSRAQVGWLRFARLVASTVRAMARPTRRMLETLTRSTPRPPELIPITRPAALVSHHARSLSGGRTAVEIRVAHVHDLAASSAGPNSYGGTIDQPIGRDLLIYSALGVAFAVTTRQVPLSAALDSPAFVISLIGGESSGLRGAIRRLGALPAMPNWSPVAKGGAVVTLNARPPRDGTHDFEILVAFADDPDLSDGQAARNVTLLASLTATARRHQVIPTFLHLPAAPPAVPSAAGPDEPRPSEAQCLRMGLRTRNSFPLARLAFLRAVRTLPELDGLDLYVGEFPGGQRLDYWRKVPSASEARPAATLAAEIGAVSESVSALMVTILGPASSDTAWNVAKLARFFAKWSVGCHSVSASMLQGTIIVNLVLAVPAGTNAERIAGLLRKAELEPEEHDWPHGYRAILLDRATLTAPRRRNGQPFWVTWSIPAAVPVVQVRDAIVSGFAEFGCQARVSLIRAYRSADDQLNGLAKVSVDAQPTVELTDTFPAEPSRRLAVLAKRAQHEVRQMLLGLAVGGSSLAPIEGPGLDRRDRAGVEFGTGSGLATDPGRTDRRRFAEHEVDVRIAWGERWLGGPP